MSTRSAAPWMVSLHGGHSVEFCDHATGALRDLIEAAIAKGLSVWGMTEHAPRVEARFLYPEEVKRGWDVVRLLDNFQTYALQTRRFIEEYDDRITLLRGFEIEVVPTDRYAELMRGYREQYALDYCVGSVHYVDEMLFDLGPESYRKAVEAQGSLEAFVVKYYQTVADMVKAVVPEVVGHLDLVRKYPEAHGPVDTPAMRDACLETLAIIRQHDCILDINTAGFRKGLDAPYCDPWILEQARDMGIGVCFGDDSHCARDVGAGIPEARDYLLDNGFTHITALTRERGAIVRKRVPLDG